VAFFFVVAVVTVSPTELNHGLARQAGRSGTEYLAKRLAELKKKHSESKNLGRQPEQQQQQQQQQQQNRKTER
jgi:hypothetical protein